MEDKFLENNDFEVLTKDGYKSFNKLKKTYRPTLTFTFNNCDVTITISTNHRFYYDDTGVNIKYADEFKEGDWITHEDYGFLCINTIIDNGDKPVYDLVDVDTGNHAYITNGFNSHNCEFQGASNTLIPSNILLELNSAPEAVPTGVQNNGYFRIYEDPIPGKEYVIGVDPAEGLGKDYFVVQVLKIEPDDIQILTQVAVYRSNDVKLEKAVQAAIGIGKYYNNAWAMVENNNSCGGLATHHFWHTYEYENMVNPDKAKKGKLGVNANVASKYKANVRLRDMLENYRLKLVDTKTIEELNSYEEIKSNIWAAGNSSVHDDTVTSLLWAIMFLDSKYYVNFKAEYGSEIDEEFMIVPPAFRTSNSANKKKF
jgi:hypothetical protein